MNSGTFMRGRRRRRRRGRRVAYLAEGSWRTTCGGEVGGWSWLQVVEEDVDGRGRKKKKKICSGEKEERKERREKLTEIGRAHV